jgi:MFS family permease
MVYAGSLPYLLSEWKMTAAQAGSVQAAYNIAYAVSLLVASWLADRIGAKIVFSGVRLERCCGFSWIRNRRTFIRVGIDPQCIRCHYPRRHIHAIHHAGRG